MVGERGVGEGTGGCMEAEKQQSKVKVVVVGGGGMRGFSRQIDFVDLVNY